MPVADRMGAMQARVIAADLKKIHDEVTHWQAAHPDAQDVWVNTLESSLSHALKIARIIDGTRRTP